MSYIHDAVLQVQCESGWRRPLSLSEMAEAWRGFVKECELGYDWSIYEYDNDLSIRSRIELILQRPEWVSEPAVQGFAHEVHAADERFRKLLLHSVEVGSPGQPWWTRGVLARAGEEYARDVKEQWGIEVEVVE